MIAAPIAITILACGVYYQHGRLWGLTRGEAALLAGAAAFVCGFLLYAGGRV